MTASELPPLKTNPHHGSLVIGVAGVSFAAIFIRLADTEPLAIAAYRMGIAALVISTVSLVRARHQIKYIRRDDIPWLLIGGILLAVHFGAFITSLSLTSVGNSVFLVTTTPVFVALGSHWGLREKLSLSMVGGIALSILGGSILALSSLDSESRMIGDVLAILGAIAAAGYFLVGRRTRGHVPLLPYVTIVYGISAALLLATAIVAEIPLTGLSASSYFWMAMVALISQVLGHTALNWSLAYTTATTVALSVRVEPLVATFLAFLILNEPTPWTMVPGGVLVLAGVLWAIRSEQRSTSGSTKSLH